MSQVDQDGQDTPLSSRPRARPPLDAYQIREDARSRIGLAIVACFGFVVVASFATFWFRDSASTDDVVKIVQAVLSPVVAIVGTVTGFYFGTSVGRGRSDRERGD